MSLNRLLTISTFWHTGTNLQLNLIPRMDNVCPLTLWIPEGVRRHWDGYHDDFVGEKYLSGFNPDYFLIEIDHNIDIFNHKGVIGNFARRNIYICTSVRHPLKVMGSSLRYWYIHHSRKSESEFFDLNTGVERVKDKWMNDLRRYKLFLEGVFNNKNQSNVSILYVDKMSNIASGEERLQYVKNVYLSFGFGWNQECEDIILENRKFNVSENAIDNKRVSSDFPNKDLFLDFYDEILCSVINGEMAHGFDWGAPLKDLCNSDLVTKKHGYGNIEFTEDEFGRLSKRKTS